MCKKYLLFFPLLFFSIESALSQSLTDKESDYLSRHISNIKVDATYTNGNWRPIIKQVKRKRIVLLGEFNHGSKEIFLTRNDLIKSLHEKLAFDVILFESGIGELGVVDLQKNDLSPRQMTYGFFSGWRTQEFRDLMAFVKENNIPIAGFDVQRTGGNFERLLKTTASALSSLKHKNYAPNT